MALIADNVKPLPSIVYGSLDFLFSDVSGETRKRLYIIAGPSGSGIDSLIHSAAECRAPIFGQDGLKWPYFNALYKLSFCNERLTGNQPFEVTSGGVLSLDGLLAMAQLGLSPALVTFLHIDLAASLEFLYRTPQDGYWSDRVDPFSLDVSNDAWSELFYGFWVDVLVERLRDTNFSFDAFDEIAVNFVSAPRLPSMFASLAAERPGNASYCRALEVIYSDSSASERMYQYHLQGWKKWVKCLSLVRPVKICTTSALLPQSKYLIRTEEGTMKLFSRHSKI